MEVRPSFNFENKEGLESLSKEKVFSAWELAKEIHKEDVRKISGEPYFSHCVAVASILEQWGADEDEIVAGLLHDTVEDHPDLICFEVIEELYGERVAKLVDGVTQLKSREGEKNEFETLRKVTRESLIEPGVALIKLADRYHNMSTMEGMKPKTVIKKSRETLSVYAPLAESFGLWQIKNALQDMAFSFLEPEKYLEVKTKIDGDPRLNEKFILETEKCIREEMMKYDVAVTVEHQVGGYWTLYQKQRRLALASGSSFRQFKDITDVVSFRVIVEEEKMEDCYKAMGIMRLKYGKMLDEKRHDDYLIRPAANGYSAIHDSYNFDEGCVELAFTTRQKENFNNIGVLSLPKEELTEHKEKYQRKLIFTPKGELVFMQPLARGIDVAYKLSPRLGMKAMEILIDGQEAKLSDVVPHAGVVEFVMDPLKQKPDKEWLEVGSEATKRVIEQQLIQSEHDEEVQRGKDKLIEGVLRERGILDLSDLTPEVVEKILLDFGCWNGIKDLYYKVAMGLDLEVVEQRLVRYGIEKGKFATVQIKGQNKIGISQTVAMIILKNGGDAMAKVERVGADGNFSIRILMQIKEKNKGEMTKELLNNFDNCEVV